MQDISYRALTQNTHRSVDLGYSSSQGGVAYAIAVKNLCVGKPSWKILQRREKVQCMPYNYPSQLATQEVALGSQFLLYSISFIEGSTSHMRHGAHTAHAEVM